MWEQCVPEISAERMKGKSNWHDIEVKKTELDGFAKGILGMN